jgi:hypothetical protein
MKTGIYRITNKVTGKSYVGNTKHFRRRWQRHRELLRQNLHHSKKLQGSWNKHGEGAWEWVVVEECPVDVLLEREQHYITLFNACFNGYNTSPKAQTCVIGEERKKVLQGGRRGADCVRGSRWMTNPVTGTKRVLLSRIKECLVAGWHFGRDSINGQTSPNKGNKLSPAFCSNQRANVLGRIWISSPDGKIKRIWNQQLDEYLEKRWSLGRSDQRGKRWYFGKPWNKGLTTVGAEW